MRILLVVVVLAAAVPALAMTPEQEIQVQTQLRAQREYEAARSKERKAEAAKANAVQKARCERLGNVRIGLNAEGVLKSCWGKPTSINTTKTADHTQEQWAYGTGHYVYFTDGIVTSIQTSR